MNALTVTLSGWRRVSHGCIAAMATALAVLFCLALAGSADSQVAGCGTIQKRVDAAAAGSTVNLPDGCLYRETVTLNRPITLVGGPGVEIRGSDVWTGWTRDTAGRWVSEDVLPDFPSQDWPCEPGTLRCRWPEQVFFDGGPLEQVASEPESGQFAVDGDRRVVLADDPGGHTVEVTVRQRWVVGRTGGVTIKDFIMKHAANGAQSGAIANNAYPDWTVENNDLSYAHGANVTLGGATGLRILGNEIHHAGWCGLSGSNAYLEVRDNEIHHNNTEGFYPSWAAGGMKVAVARRFVADGNDVHHNVGNGIWVDERAEEATISNNRVYDNAELSGIRYEVSRNGAIFGNQVWGNADAGISVATSSRVNVYDNVLAWNGRGIVVVNAERKDASESAYNMVRHVSVHENDIMMDAEGGLALAWFKTYAGGNIYRPKADNRGRNNSYWYAASRDPRRDRFFWKGRIAKLRTFNATLGERRGRYLSDAEKEQVLADEAIPQDAMH